jgi:hypothetical protein
MIWGGKLSVDPDRAKGFQDSAEDPSEPGSELTPPHFQADSQTKTPGRPKSFRGVAGYVLDAEINPQEDRF